MASDLLTSHILTAMLQAYAAREKQRGFSHTNYLINTIPRRQGFVIGLLRGFCDRSFWRVFW
jgi:hypothetical protein